MRANFRSAGRKGTANAVIPVPGRVMNPVTLRGVFRNRYENKKGVDGMKLEKINTGAGEIAVVRPDEAEAGSAYLRAEVGTLEGNADKNSFVLSALRGNFLYLDTDGATLSLGKDGVSVYLTYRCADAVLDAEETRSQMIDSFTAVVRIWRERLDSGKRVN